MTQWPKGESSPTGRGYVDSFSSHDAGQYQADIAWMAREDERRREELARTARLENRTDREAIELILQSAKAASKVHWASGNLALIEQICEQQLNGEPHEAV